MSAESSEWCPTCGIHADERAWIARMNRMAEESRPASSKLFGVRSTHLPDVGARRREDDAFWEAVEREVGWTDEDAGALEGLRFGGGLDLDADCKGDAQGNGEALHDGPGLPDDIKPARAAHVTRLVVEPRTEGGVYGPPSEWGMDIIRRALAE